MHITRLRLTGFKSFVEPTDLLIEPGLTGVVGPNGCGKSNLLEALRWAMGEASHKSMRAAAMDDVIFAGTTIRPARDHASVTLFIDNSGRQAPAEFNDSDTLEIVRHIEREAGSAYRINGREARARDVKILFEDAATGARSPALVRQGQIAEIVNAKPEQRRRILEDAAGTAGLSSRRHDAELRLRATEANLVRVSDVLGGMTSQIAVAKRQQRAAERYLAISAEIKSLEAIALYLAWHGAHLEAITEEAQLSEVLGLLAAATEGETRALVAEAVAARRLPDLRDAEAAAAAAFQRLRHEAEGLEREEARARERQADLTTRVSQLAADAARETTQAAEAAAAAQSLAAEQSSLTAEAENAEHGLTEAARVLDTARAAETSANAQLDSLTARLAELRAQRQRLDSQRADEQRRLARAGTQQAEATRLHIEVTAQHAASAHTELAVRRDAAADALEVLDDRIAAAEKALVAARASEDKARTLSQERRMAVEKLATEHATLARLFAPPKDARWVAVLNGIKVARGFEVALGAALGEDLDAPADARAPVHWSAIAARDGETALPEGTEPLSAKVKNAGVLLRRLHQIGIVVKADGPRLQAALLPGQRLVSREGDLWRWDGFTAAADAPSAAARRLEQRNRLEELEAAVASAKDAAADAADDFAVAAAARDAAAAAERAGRDEQRRSRHEHAELSAQLAGIEKSEREREGKLILLVESVRQAVEAISEHRGRLTELDRELSGQPDQFALAAEQSASQAEAQRLRAETGRADLAVSALHSAARQLTQRLAVIAADMARWQARAAASVKHVDALTARWLEAAAQLKELADLPRQIAETRARLMTEIANAEVARNAAADALTVAETGARDAAKLLREIQAEASAAREVKARAETRLDAARTRRTAEAQRIREILDCAPEHCLDAANVDPSVGLAQADDTVRRLARLREDRDRLGGVNLAAAEELTALEARFASLDAERIDLEAAIAQLRLAIGKLTREGRKRLNEAFEQVNGHFQRLFTTLFNGGEARLEMVEDPEDPLAGGLEIIAKPPGKKPATLSLLSGGEQTLTALSLIFAVFLTNPSPICVLDEVDAPLDDSNVDRFCTLMEEMARSTETRFLVITHHPMTMARMDRLFGVTMAEKGVSQLVSVDLATAEQFREAG